MTDREIIIYLAEKVMGWEVFSLNRHDYDELRHSIHRLVENVEHNWNYFPPGKPGNLWNPLENIADAFEVNEKLGGFDMIAVDDGWMVGNGTSGYTNDEGRIEVQLEFFAIAKTLPRAICMSALEATK